MASDCAVKRALANRCKAFANSSIQSHVPFVARLAVLSVEVDGFSPKAPKAHSVGFDCRLMRNASRIGSSVCLLLIPPRTSNRSPSPSPSPSPPRLSPLWILGTHVLHSRSRRPLTQGLDARLIPIQDVGTAESGLFLQLSDLALRRFYEERHESQMISRSNWISGFAHASVLVCCDELSNKTGNWMEIAGCLCLSMRPHHRGIPSVPLPDLGAKSGIFNFSTDLPVLRSCLDYSAWSSSLSPARYCPASLYLSDYGSVADSSIQESNSSAHSVTV